MSSESYIKNSSYSNFLNSNFSTEKNDSYKMFIGGIPKDANYCDIYNYFKLFGEITKIDLKSDLLINKNRGFGFVFFKEKTVVNSILEKKPHFILNKQIEVELAIPKKSILVGKSESSKEKKECSDISDRKLYVKGLKSYMNEKDLVNSFSKFGTIDECFIKRFKNVSRGFGFVIFKEKESMENLLRSNSIIKIKGNLITYERAIPKISNLNEKISNSSLISSEKETNENINISIESNPKIKSQNLSITGHTCSTNSSVISNKISNNTLKNECKIKNTKVFDEILFLPNYDDSYSENNDIFEINDKHSSQEEESFNYYEKMIDEKVIFDTNKFINSLDDEFPFSIKN